VHDRRQLLATGDSIVFDADQPHSLRNPGDTEARAFRVTVNAETPPRWDVPQETPHEVPLAHAHSEV
jgi:mannose-6-phosphate isomerase-like protein (cupin superfamily)